MRIMSNGYRFILVAIAGLAGMAQAALLVQEGFDYATVSPINGSQTGGTGFAAASNWGSANGDIVAGLSYPGLATSGSGAFKKTAGYCRLERALAASFGGSTFYMSMVINTYGQNDNRFGVELRNGDGPCFGRVNGGWGFFMGDNGKGGISNSGGSYQTWTGVTRAPDSEPHLFVVKFDYAANAIKIWVDPIPDGDEPTPSATLVTGDNWTISLNSDFWTGLGFYSESANETIDEVRVGTTWGDVIPATVISVAATVQEGFDYAPVSPIDGTQTGGVGFASTSPWGTERADIVAGLSYTGLVFSGTGAIKSVTDGNFRHPRALASGFGGSTFYISVLINPNNRNAGRFGPELRGGKEGPCFGRVTGGWGMFQGQSGALGISNATGEYKTWTGVTAATDNATHLIVVEADYTANAIKLFVDPVAGGAEPAPSATLATGGDWTVNLNSDTWTALSLFHDAGDMTADEFRVGRTWGAVVPPLVSTWTKTVGGTYGWVTRANWSGDTVPNPVAGCTIDCGTAALAGDMTLKLDADRTATTWIFGDTAGAQTWTLNAGTAGSRLVLAGLTPAIQVNTNMATLNAVINGTAGLVKSGAGKLVLAAMNTYSGATTVSAGTLTLGASGTLPSGNGIVLAGGTLELSASATNSAGSLNVTSGSTLALGNGTGRLTFTGDSSAYTWTGNLTLTGALRSQTLGESALRFAPYGLTASQLRRISLDGASVYLSANGYLMPGPHGTIIIVL